ncbi:MAG: rhodanese-like domain-containing protein [Bacteroidota bacterium]
MKTVLLALLFAVPVLAQERTQPVYVSTEWLADHLNDPSTFVLHVGFNRAEYSLGHIPEARFLWYNWLAESTPDASTEMPPVKQVDTLFEALGITKNSQIVLCFSGANVSITTRMFLALSYYGFGNQTSILDGGLEAWKKESRPVSKETPAVKRTSLTLKTKPSVITNADWVKANLVNPQVAIVDARSKNFYDGTGGGISRQGHIKGAKSIPFTTLYDSTNKILSPASLQKIFDEAGIKKGTKVVSYCHVGQQATTVYSVALQLGYDAAVYDGSFEDWNVRGDDYPVEKPEPPKADTATSAHTGKYVCPPCGSTCDKQEFDKAGSCPTCGMTLVEKKP